MQFLTTSIYQQNAEAWLKHKEGIRRSLNEGGTSSSKTFSILQTLILIARHARNPFLISVVSESLPHLKRGCIRDLFTLLDESPNNNPRYNMSDHIYTFGKGAIEFFPADDAAKLRGGRRKILFINEANNIPYDAFRELDIRTELFTFMDWNPTSEFWAHEHLIGKPENVYIHSTYLDALHVLPPEVVKNIESNRGDPNWWNVYGLGRIGKVEGLVYPYFEQETALPEHGDTVYGLDFGFAGDEAALTRNVLLPGEVHSQQIIYAKNLTNQDLSLRMEQAGIRKNFDEIFADSAEPKSIEELHRLGWNIKGCPKGEGSVEFGHQKLRQLKQFWTEDSLDGIKEQRNFRYIADKDGKLTEKTTHNYSHLMDSRRYAVVGKLSASKWGLS
jgi:phage terminase large subunit